MKPGLMVRWLAVALAVLPWIYAGTSGPSPGVLPWLVSAAAATGLLLFFCLPESLALPVKPSVDRLASDGWLLAGLLSAAMGLIQYAGLASQVSPWINQASIGEAFANLRQRNQFATLTNIALCALLFQAGRHGRQSLSVICLACAALLAAGNAASSSRTGLAQLLLLCCVPAMWPGWQARVGRLLAVALFAYVAALALLPLLAGFDVFANGALARLQAGDAACASRLTLWSNVLHLIAQKPWFGWGWGELDYAHYITLYDGPRFCDILDNAHNLPLHLAVELGIPAAVLVCGLLAWWVARRKPWRETDPARQMAWAVLAVVLLHSLLEYPLWYGPFQMAVGLCLALLWRRKTDGDASSRLGGSGHAISAMAVMPRLVLYAAGVAVLAGCAYAAWDYHRISQIYLPPAGRDAAYRDGTLEKIRGSRLFRNEVSFAELGMTALTPANAQWTHETATRMLHFSPEPRVIEKVIESATMLGLNDEAVLHLARLRAAFPAEYARWTQANGVKPVAVIPGVVQ